MANSMIICAQCGKKASRPNSNINRTKKTGGKLFCSMLCSGKGNRKNKPKSMLTKLSMVTNNYLSGSKRWSVNGVIMNLELPSMIYRSNV